MKIAEILIVAADEILGDITSFRLELLGYRVRLASSGEQALTMLKDHLPNMFMIHLDLPGLSGTALIEQLATENETVRIPVLEISLNADLESVQRTVAAGASDYLVVPYDPRILDEKVTKLLSESEAVGKLEKQTSAKA